MYLVDGNCLVQTFNSRGEKSRKDNRMTDKTKKVSIPVEKQGDLLAAVLSSVVAAISDEKTIEDMIRKTGERLTTKYAAKLKSDTAPVAQQAVHGMSRSISETSKAILELLASGKLAQAIKFVPTDTGFDVTISGEALSTLEGAVDGVTLMKIMDYGNSEIAPLPFLSYFKAELKRELIKELKMVVTDAIRKNLDEVISNLQEA